MRRSGASSADGGHGPLRAVAGRVYRGTVAVLQRADPTRLALRRPPPGTSVLLACVYRGRNAGTVRALLAGLPPGTEVRLWSLDGAVPADLAPLTAGQGPGDRTTHLNRLVAGASADAVVLVDDDVRFAVGSLAQLVDAGLRLDLDVYQPAHLASSYAGWDFVRRRSGVFARLTDFVEQGPLLVLSRRGAQELLPFPADDGMSWGVEVTWWAQARETSLRLGIVDAVAVRHLAPAAGAYDRPLEQQRLERRLAEHGLTSLEQLHVVRERLQPRPGRRGAG